MKKCLFTLLLIYGYTIYSQPSFHYKFKINAVTNLAEAKMITDPLRSKFKTYPTFTDTNDYFEFDADVDVTETDLFSLLSSLSYYLAEFSKQQIITPPVIIKDK